MSDLTSQEQEKPHHVRGFASMDPEKRRAIAGKGGKNAHALGTAHQWNSEEARAAGKKGRDRRRRSKYAS